MPTITIHRTSQPVNRMRAIQIYLDERKIGEISNGETKTFEVPAGQQILKATIDWCGSPDVPITLTENSHLSFELGGLRGWKLLMLYYYLSAAKDEYLYLKPLN